MTECKWPLSQQATLKEYSVILFLYDSFKVLRDVVLHLLSDFPLPVVWTGEYSSCGCDRAMGEVHGDAIREGDKGPLWWIFPRGL